MLIIDVPETELFNDETYRVTKCMPVQLRLEHSLVSISKWEAIWGKSFLSNRDSTREEQQSYVRCMLITKNVSDDLVEVLFVNHMNEINGYISHPMTATFFYEHSSHKGRPPIITAELIYYWMIAFSIPFKCETWHLNKLLVLVKVCNIKNSKDKKMDQRSILRSNAELNKRRKEELNKG